MRRITWLLALVLTAGVLTAAGCGGDDDDSGERSSGGTGTSSGGSSSGAGAAHRDRRPGRRDLVGQDRAERQGRQGHPEARQRSEIPHAIEVEGNGVEKETETVTGGNADLTVDLKPGKYEFYCPVRRPQGRRCRARSPCLRSRVMC